MKPNQISKLEREVARTREHIDTLKAERNAVFNQCRSRAEVALAVDAQIANMAAAGSATIARSLQMFAAGTASSPMMISGVAGADGVARIDIGPLLVAAVGVERMREVYLAALSSVPVGLSADDRVQRLTEIACEIEIAEVMEESWIAESEDAGHPIARRADARAEVILAER